MTQLGSSMSCALLTQRQRWGCAHLLWLVFPASPVVSHNSKWLGSCSVSAPVDVHLHPCMSVHRDDREIQLSQLFSVLSSVQMLLIMVATADLCATSATTSALCPAVSDDSSQSLCPDLALGATCSALAGKHYPLLAIVTKKAASPGYFCCALCLTCDASIWYCEVRQFSCASLR